jgi:uncharacterized protein
MADVAFARNAARPRALGVGLTYIGALPPELYTPALLDFVELTPETLCRHRQIGARHALRLVPEQVERAQATCGKLPIAVHGVELSIGSVHGMNQAYLEMLDRFQLMWPFLWHSEHLGFQTFEAEDGTVQDIGVPLPMPSTEESASVVAERAKTIQKRYGVPFLLENPAHYLPDLPCDPTVGDESGLMSAIVRQANCGQLLDLHNLYCNAVNHNFDAVTVLDRMLLDRVMEIHLAGGTWQDGFWTDAHSGCVPEPVWNLLDHTLSRCKNLLGIVFEILEEHAVRIAPEVIAEEVVRARAAWLQSRVV